MDEDLTYRRERAKQRDLNKHSYWGAALGLGFGWLTPGVGHSITYFLEHIFPTLLGSIVVGLLLLSCGFLAIAGTYSHTKALIQRREAEDVPGIGMTLLGWAGLAYFAYIAWPMIEHVLRRL